MCVSGWSYIFYQQRLSNFPFNGVISITFTDYIKVLYFRVFMSFFDGMLYQMGFSISTIMVKYSFWQPSCRFSSIVFRALTFWTFNIINNIMLMHLCSVIFYVCKLLLNLVPEHVTPVVTFSGNTHFKPV